MAHPLILVGMMATVGIVLFSIYIPLLKVLEERGMYRTNFKGDSIPTAVGLMIPLSASAALPWIWLDPIRNGYLLQCMALFIIAAVGWCDDRWGGNEAKGLKGHFQLWRRSGVISTGLWKAFIGLAMGVLISSFSAHDPISFIRHVLILVLLTNVLNLLDLRPGRALKGFFIIGGFILATSYASLPFPLWAPIMLAAVLLFPFDLRGRIMLGDTGSNSLGFALAFWVVFYTDAAVQWLMLGAMVLIQWYAERKSITVLIQRVPLLHWLDMLGRRV